MDKIAITTNTTEKYAVVDSAGKIIEKFRGKSSALNWVNENKKNYFCKLSVITLGGQHKNERFK